MNYFRKVLGTPQGGNQPSSAETIERLCDRVQSSTLLEDRRDAVRALKSLSKKYALEVGTQAMDILIKVLETDRSDAEIIGYSLDTLCNIMSNEPSDDDSMSLTEDELSNHIPDDLGGQFTEIFIKSTENVTLLLLLLEEYDFHVRWPIVKLLTILLTNKSKEIQEIILISPMGVSKLMDLLSDSREIIRNDALLLLIQLTKGNANIQKIVAFENAFERLLDIIREEGNSDGGIVVEDCLLLMLNLMKTNTSNQNFFKEGSYIQKLTPYFQLESSSQSAGWSAQKVTNIHLMFQLVRTLVSPNNPLNQTAACQKVMNSCNLLKQLCTILMASGVPADVLTATINTVSEIIRGNLANQEFFASVMAPSKPPRPAIVVLLMSMVNEKQPFVLRCAVLYCFQSFLFKNEVGQSQIVQTLLPTTADGERSNHVNTITAGQLLCGGLFSGDSLSNWFASVALLHAILENNTQREQLLRVQLATSLGNPPVSLLQQCCNMLAQGGKLQTRIGLLMLLCGWLSDCSIAVTHFLCNTANVPYLIAQISASEGEEQEQLVQGLCAFLLGISVLFNDDQNETFNKDSLCKIIANRIGMETFIDKLSQVTKNESYTKAAKKAHLNYKHPNEVIFDYEFTRLFKSLENEVLRAVSVSDSKGKTGLSASIHEHSSIVIQYKELIREQDLQLNELRKELKGYKSQSDSNKEEFEESKQQIQQLKDQNAVLKAQKGSQDGKNEIAQLKQEIETLQTKLKTKDDEMKQISAELIAAKAACVNLNELTSEENKENCPTETARLHASIQQLSSELSELRHTVAAKDEQIKATLSQKEQLEKMLEKSDSKDETSSASEERLIALDEQVKTVQNEKASLQTRLTKSNDENLKLLDKIKKLEEEKTALNNEKANVLADTESLKKEQDDLLVLLSEQDGKIEEYKEKLKELGCVIEDDDDEDDDDLDVVDLEYGPDESDDDKDS
ncbi:general vesicular transport factor p115 isoform X2 [Octopus sinensis]|uniref:General vesicular transport factor p115 isoform X2 n=1 Tax=Octopus sinensis TaxID=2607531 RepID=A0A6P7SBP3_9MOLL|nr:general vesicular transport factor p115 isoform X2 [Octopus sinensis]